MNICFSKELFNKESVFKSIVDKKTWHVGHNFMTDKYYFFDMGPYDNNQIAFLQIGIGPLKKTNIIG